MSFYNGRIGKLLDKYKRLGAEEGGKNRPPSDSTTLDKNEVELIGETTNCNLEINRQYIETRNNIRQKKTELNEKINNFTCNDKHDSVSKKIENSFKNVFELSKEKAIISCASFMKSQAVLNAFKEKYKINYPAYYPEDKVHHCSIIILFIVIETCLNAFFYRNEAGLLGGAIIALSVSVINMFLAVLCGYLYRYKNLQEIKNKMIGYSAISVFVFLGITFNLIFATFRISYREEFSKEYPDLINAFLIAVKQAFGVFLLNFPRIDFESFILFFLGIIFSIIAFYKGFTLDDKTPGYSFLDKEYKNNEKHYFEMIDSIYREAKTNIDEQKKSFEDLISQLNSIRTSTIALDREFRNKHNEYISDIEQLQNDFIYVIKQYRLSNTSVRTTPPPDYFSENEERFFKVQTATNQDEFDKELKELEQLINSAKTKESECLQKLQDLVFLIEQQSYKDLTDAFEGFKKLVKDEAIKKINDDIIHLRKTIR